MYLVLVPYFGKYKNGYLNPGKLMEILKTSFLPTLSVRRGAAAVEFYKSAFNAEVLFCIADPGGAIVAKLSIDGVEFLVADESPEYENYSSYPQTL